MSEEFALFIDDSGSPKPNLKDSSPFSRNQRTGITF